jgi:hypothetical protein
MSLQVLLIAVAGMLPAQGAPGNVIIKSYQFKDYAKVEIQGSLRSAGRRPGEPVAVEIDRRGMKKTTFPLDLSELKGWTDERLKRYDGRLVRVTGTLVGKTPLAKGESDGQFKVLAETLELRQTDHALVPGKTARLADAQFAKVEIQAELVTQEIRGTAPFWLGAAGIRFALDSSKLKGWTEQKLRTYCNGRDVRITGTLETRHFKVYPSRPKAGDGIDEDRITVVAETIKFLEPYFVAPKGP